MNKKIVFGLLLLLPTIFLSGCWNYVGLNEISIVAGVAVDRCEQPGFVKLSFEIINTNEDSKGKGAKSEVLESRGRTIFDAVRNAKKKVSGKLYFGNSQIIIISEEIAKGEDILSYLDFFFRDIEARETSYVIVSLEKTAAKILDAKLTESVIVSYEIRKMLDKDNTTTSSTQAYQIYEIYNHIKEPGGSLVLPTVHVVENGEKSVYELAGIAVFQKNNLRGYLSAEESKYFLFIHDDIKGGIVPFINQKDERKVEYSLEIRNSKTRVEIDTSGKPIKAIIKIYTKGYLGEANGEVDFYKYQEISSIEEAVELTLKTNILQVVRKAQYDYETDMFCFGNQIYKKNPKLWKEMGDNWEVIFPELEIIVECKVDILNTATLNKS